MPIYELGQALTHRSQELLSFCPWSCDDEHFHNINGNIPNFSSKVTNWTSARKDAVTMPPTTTLERYSNINYREEVIRLKYLCSNNNNKRCNVKFQLQCRSNGPLGLLLCFKVELFDGWREVLFENPIFDISVWIYLVLEKYTDNRYCKIINLLLR